MNKGIKSLYTKIGLSIICLCATIVINFSHGASIRTIIYPENIQTQTNKNIGDIASNIIKTQLQLHKQLEDNIITQETDPLSLLYQFESLIKKDLLKELDRQEDRGSILNTYLSETATILPQGEIVIFDIEKKIDEAERRITFCKEQKGLVESDFYTALGNFNQVAWENSIEGLIENNRCIAEQETKSNTYKILRDRLENSHTLLQKKYTYLNIKRDLIIKHFEVIKNDIAKDLIDIRNKLNQYNQVQQN